MPVQIEIRDWSIQEGTDYYEYMFIVRCVIYAVRQFISRESCGQSFVRNSPGLTTIIRYKYNIKNIKFVVAFHIAFSPFIVL